MLEEKPKAQKVKKDPTMKTDDADAMLNDGDALMEYFVEDAEKGKK